MRISAVFVFVFVVLPFLGFTQNDSLRRFKTTDPDYNQQKAQGEIPRGALILNDTGGNVPAQRISPIVSPSSSVLCDCMVPIDASFSVVPFTIGSSSNDYRNDDGSSPNITLPFNFCFYGQNNNSCYINNNGNVSFGASYGTFSANPFPDPTFIMVAPFWADVDTRAAGSGVVYYKITPTAMIVRWKTVGYYSVYDDKLNDFQLIITDGTDPILPAGNNVSFCYGDMQWTTGDASSGTNGFGGTPATVGCNLGDGVNYLQIGRFDQPGTNYDGPFGNPDQVSWLDNQTFYFNVCNNGSGNNLPPIINSDDVCDTMWICVGDTIDLGAIFLAPEQGQGTNITMTTPSSGLNITNNTGGNPATITAEYVGAVANLGYNVITVTGTDNGTPPASTASTIVVAVVNSPSVSFSFTPASPSVAPVAVQFTANTPGAVLWLWNFGDGNTSTVENPQHTFNGDSVYTVTLTACLQSGCCNTYTSTYEVIGGVPIIAPNVVTPNDDGINDELVFTNLHFYVHSNLNVYDRWGALVYAGKDYQNDWVPNVVDGVYYYELTGLYIYTPITGFFQVVRDK
jgi:gliding motility-associated-like protein